MKLLDILRKLGIFRSGNFSGTYKSGKEIPAELLMDNVFDSKKDLINKEDLKQIKNNLKSDKKSLEIDN